MLTELCQELRNWFDRGQPKWYGTFTIENGALVLRDDMSLKDGQYFRIVGSALNDGVYQYGSTPIVIDGDPTGLAFSIEDGHLMQDTDNAIPHYHYRLEDEAFTGAIWAMAVPPSVVALSEEIDKWTAKNEDIDSSNMSPFQSESFEGYSYNKGYGGNGSRAGGGSVSWQDMFRTKLNRWRKI